MSGKFDDLLPNASELRRQTAVSEAGKADEFVRLLTEAESEKMALVESLDKTFDVLEESKIKLIAAIIQRAARSGLFEVQVYRFSDSLCTDGGRAIGSNAVAWESTLAGVPHEIYGFWSEYLQPRGYHIRYIMSGLPGVLPNNIGIVIGWGD